MKYKAIVHVEYQFEFDSESRNRRELEDHAEYVWSQFTDLGRESEKYHDTEIRVYESE